MRYRRRLAGAGPAVTRSTGPGRGGGGPGGLASDVAPDWVAVRREWDGVHLSFGGLLAASLVPLGRAGERTALWTWECEQTCWLRDVFAARADLPR